MTSIMDARRIEVLHAAAELLALKPASSLAEIASHAGIGKATLHRYFSSREDLMLALGYQALEMVSQAIQNAQLDQGSAIEALTRVSEALVPLGDKLHFLLNEPTVDTHPDFKAAENNTLEPLYQLVQRGQSSGELRSDLSPTWILYILNYALFATWQSVHEGDLARREAPAVLMTTLFKGIATR